MPVLKRKTFTTPGWPPARRAAQSARLRTARIWERSTGPKTAAGQSRSAQNALRAGRHTASRRLFRRIFRLQRHVMRNLRHLHGFMARFPHLDHTRREETLRRNQHLMALLMPVIIQGMQGNDPASFSVCECV